MSFNSTAAARPSMPCDVFVFRTRQLEVTVSFRRTTPVFTEGNRNKTFLLWKANIATFGIMPTCIHSSYFFHFIQNSAFSPPEPELVCIYICLPMAPPDSNCSECKVHGAPCTCRSRLVVCAVKFIIMLPRCLESGTSAPLIFSMFLLAQQLSHCAALHLVSPTILQAQPDPPFLQ